MTFTRTNSLWSVDTHILIYATQTNTPAAKQSIARELVRELYASPHGCVLGQVLSEFMHTAIRNNDLTHEKAINMLNLVSTGVRVLGASREAYTQAWELVGKHQYSVWHALGIAVCAEQSVKTLYSEETGSLRRPLGVHVVNPFAALDNS